MKTSVYLVSLFSLLVFSPAIAQTISFDFSQGSNLFTGGVSDFGVHQSDQHQFVFENEALPPPFPPGMHAQYLSGTNPSDDLFMYLKRKITGLQPYTTYLVTFQVEFASIYPTNGVGVGGAPGEGVTMKAGMTLIEPDTMIVDKGGPFVVMNIDKGNQSQSGADMDSIGHVGIADTTTVYTLKTNDNVGRPFTFTTDERGEAWIIVGTDSGYESTTALYYTRITADMDIISSNDRHPNDAAIRIYPNPSAGNIYIDAPDLSAFDLSVVDAVGRRILNQRCTERSLRLSLTSGLYYLLIETDQWRTVRKVLIL